METNLEEGGEKNPTVCAAEWGLEPERRQPPIVTIVPWCARVSTFEKKKTDGKP